MPHRLKMAAARVRIRREGASREEIVARGRKGVSILGGERNR
jgi:hypothetical protein